MVPSCSICEVAYNKLQSAMEMAKEIRQHIGFEFAVPYKEKMLLVAIDTHDSSKSNPDQKDQIQARNPLKSLRKCSVVLDF